MTIEEAIKHAEEVADYDCYNEKQFKCTEEHRQLAEWLKDYKRLKEQEPRKDEVILTKEEYGELVSSEFDNGYTKGYTEALEQNDVLDEIRAEIEKLRFGQPLRKYVVDECLEIIDKYRESEE